MARFNDRPDRVKVAAPCNADWEQMFSFEGERVRFCSQCNLNVYNLSGMTRNEANTLLARTESRLCVRFYRRADGTVLTQNCPVGLQKFKRRVAWVAQLLLGMLLASLGLNRFEPVIKRVGGIGPSPVFMGTIERPIATTENENSPVAEIEKAAIQDTSHWPLTPKSGRRTSN